MNEMKQQQREFAAKFMNYALEKLNNNTDVEDACHLLNAVVKLNMFGFMEPNPPKPPTQ